MVHLMEQSIWFIGKLMCQLRFDRSTVKFSSYFLVYAIALIFPSISIYVDLPVDLFRISICFFTST